MELFTVDNGIVIPNKNTLLIHPFMDLWERDSSEKKTIALKEFQYIEFLCSYSKDNPYAGYDEDVKEYKIRRNVFKDNPEWLPDDLVQAGIATYISFRDEASPTLRFYLANLAGAKKLQDYYENVDLYKETRTGALVNKPSDVARGLTQATAILNSLETLRIKVQQELLDSGKTRANRTVNHFEK